MSDAPPLQTQRTADGVGVPRLSIRGLSKRYGATVALDGVDLDIAAGEVHALCGENGAGKSTLIKCLAGVVEPDTGEVRVDGAPICFGDVTRAESVGVAVIHQESTAFPDLDAVDNVFVGRERRRAGGWFLDRPSMEREVAGLMERLGQTIDLRVTVSELDTVPRQMVAMARALSHRCRVFVLDEPTASLSLKETTRLLQIVQTLRSEGVGILYVTHRLDEVFEVADKVTVLRDGAMVGGCGIGDLTHDRLIQWMVGREVDELVRHPAEAGDRTVGPKRLEVLGLTRQGAFEDVSFHVRGGEIVGMAGLVGAGRSEVARCVFGLDGYDLGAILLDGAALPPRQVQSAIRRGLALVPEDRQHQGLVLPMSISSNLTLAALRRLSWRGCGWLRWSDDRKLAVRLVETVGIKAGDASDPVSSLSGGNQQKAALGKWLATEPGVLILDEPTRGVDVGAKAEIHRLIRALAGEGMAALVISSELPELLALSDRVLVMRSGRLVGELSGSEATQERVLGLALPDGRAEAAPS